MKTKIVAILNYTPDSFSDGGEFFDIKNASAQLERFFELGADMVDIGAVSTSYNKKLLSEEEEWDRILPFFNLIAYQYGHKLSFDTFSPKNAQRAIDMGITMINDVSGMRNPQMLEVILRNQHIKYVLMCSKVLPANKEMRCKNRDEIYSFAEMQLKFAFQNGVMHDRVIFDPGIGFSSDHDLSLKIISDVAFFKKLGVPIYIGHSRKSFLEFMTVDPKNRDVETLTSSIYMMMQDVDYLRVHNVEMHIKAKKVLDAISNSQ